MPGSGLHRMPFKGADKLVHISMYAMLAFSVLLAYRRYYFRLNKRTKILINTFIFSAAYGVLMEYAQKYVFINRSFELMDIVANSIGAILGIFFYRYLVGRKISKLWYE
tara:strand:- start:83943 stop:84269 length:327 start_codon:yes stop_codon:yes gene_type:complete